MSDFLFSSRRQAYGTMGGYLRDIYHAGKPEVREFHGDWGSLAVSRNLYNGFQPIETERHIFTVIGGPVLCFADNRFLTGDDPVAGTKAIYDRYCAGRMRWDEDVSGPFVALAIDKLKGDVTCVTDLMLFIPAYQCAQSGAVLLGTHVDALARAAGQSDEIDFVSLADFIVHGLVTYPFTAYRSVRQLHPAAVHRYASLAGGPQTSSPHVYWAPEENCPYAGLEKASRELRESLRGYIGRVTEGMTGVAQFLSAGEDSRFIAGLLPGRLVRDGYIFLDSMNHEGRVAKRAAQAYGVTLHAAFRGKAHYIDMLSEASDLVGSGYRYIHAHSLGFHASCGLDRYTAVFGGFLSDVLLKGYYVSIAKRHDRSSFLPELKDVLLGPVYDQLMERRSAHLHRVRGVRPASHTEWFTIWPITMHTDVSYFYPNRRLFRSYEPFMCKEAVKIAAAVPIGWKRNRRLFHGAAKPVLAIAKYVPHADGRLPYFPWWINLVIRFHYRVWRRAGKRMGLIKGSQGPWSDLSEVIRSDACQDAIKGYASRDGRLKELFSADAEQLFGGSVLRKEQKINLLQVLYGFSRLENAGAK